MMMARPITNGGVMIGNTDKILNRRLNLKLVLAIKSAKPSPNNV